MTTLNVPSNIETSDAPTSEISSPSDTDVDEDSSNSGFNTTEATGESAVTNEASIQIVGATANKSSEECEGATALNHGRDNYDNPGNIENATKKPDNTDG